MKINQRTIQRFCLILITIVFFSCNKEGEEIYYPTFGKLTFNVTMPGGSDPLFVQLEERTIDTIKVSGAYSETMEEGDRNIKIVDGEGKILLEKSFTISNKNPLSLKSLFTGSAFLLDDNDTELKPAQDSMLVRFVTLDQTLPDIMNIDLVILYYDENFSLITIPINKHITNIRKDQFSEFIQLPNPAAFTPPGAYYPQYGIEGCDATPGGSNQKVMSIADNTYSYIFYKEMDFEWNWINNNILSMGIDAPSGGIYQPAVIFQRVAE